jgi:hypothetical protein
VRVTWAVPAVAFTPPGAEGMTVPPPPPPGVGAVTVKVIDVAVASVPLEAVSTYLAPALLIEQEKWATPFVAFSGSAVQVRVAVFVPVPDLIARVTDVVFVTRTVPVTFSTETPTPKEVLTVVVVGGSVVSTSLVAVVVVVIVNGVVVAGVSPADVAWSVKVPGLLILQPTKFTRPVPGIRVVVPVVQVSVPVPVLIARVIRCVAVRVRTRSPALSSIETLRLNVWLATVLDAGSVVTASLAGVVVAVIEKAGVVVADVSPAADAVST